MNSQEVNLGKRIVNTEDLREVVDNLVSTFESQLALIAKTLGGVDSNREVLAVVLASGEIFNVLKVAKSPSKQVGAHDRTALERHDLGRRLAALLDFLLRHVGKSSLILGNFNLKVKASLEVRLIEAGKSSTGIAGFELGGEHVVVFGVSRNRLGSGNGRLVLGAVETSHLVEAESAKAQVGLERAQLTSLLMVPLYLMETTALWD